MGEHLRAYGPHGGGRGNLIATDDCGSMRPTSKCGPEVVFSRALLVLI